MVFSSINPVPGTSLQAGAWGKVIAEVGCFLDSQDSAVIAMGHSTAGGSIGFPNVEASERRGIAILESEFEVPALAQLQISLLIHPPSSAVQAAGYDYWRPLVSGIVVTYPLK